MADFIPYHKADFILHHKVLYHCIQAMFSPGDRDTPQSHPPQTTEVSMSELLIASPLTKLKGYQVDLSCLLIGFFSLSRSSVALRRPH